MSWAMHRPALEVKSPEPSSHCSPVSALCLFIRTKTHTPTQKTFTSLQKNIPRMTQNPHTHPPHPITHTHTQTTHTHTHTHPHTHTHTHTHPTPTHTPHTHTHTPLTRTHTHTHT